MGGRCVKLKYLHAAQERCAIISAAMVFGPSSRLVRLPGVSGRNRVSSHFSRSFRSSVERGPQHDCRVTFRRQRRWARAYGRPMAELRQVS